MRNLRSSVQTARKARATEPSCDPPFGSPVHRLRDAQMATAQLASREPGSYILGSMLAHSLMQTLKAGGVTLIVILACSVMVLAVAIERSVAMWRLLDRARTLAEAVKRCLYRGALADARAACERSKSMAAEFFLVGFERHGRSDNHALEAAVDRERQRIALQLKGQLWALGTIGATAPFIGLFGTVVGSLLARHADETSLVEKHAHMLAWAAAVLCISLILLLCLTSYRQH